MTNQNSERRKAPRVAATFPIQLQGASGVTRKAELKDLSEVGLSCTFPESIDEMAAVQIVLQLPGEDRLLKVQGAVVRCHEIGAPEATHEIAVFFTKTTAESRDALRTWITSETASAH